MYLLHPRRLLAVAALVLLAGCSPTGEDIGDAGDLATTATPSATASSTPSPSPTPEDSREPESEDNRKPAGDCAAYRNSGDWCTDGIGDYDCEGGSGNGPNYAPRGVRLKEPGRDPFGLDDDDDGIGCEKPKPAPEPEPEPEPETDPRFGTCGEAIAAGYGPYYRGQDPEYSWYRDSDSDGVVCE